MVVDKAEVLKLWKDLKGYLLKKANADRKDKNLKPYTPEEEKAFKEE